MSIGQCSIIINFRLNRNSNIFANFSHQIRISNIFVIRQLTEYEYRIYSFLATWPNTNIEYIRSRKTDRIRISNIFETGKLSIRIRIYNIRWLLFEYLNIWIFSCYTAKVVRRNQKPLNDQNPWWSFWIHSVDKGGARHFMGT